uniref:Protein kinase domain-containing protein n=1 Tax=Moniliophthora roreri TaxID=221103 RepID=A0A0W0EWK8_MONRR
MVMDFIEGQTLHELYATEGVPDDVRKAVQKALDELAKGNFIFGDLRTPNIMLTKPNGDESVEKCLHSLTLTGLAVKPSLKNWRLSLNTPRQRSAMLSTVNYITFFGKPTPQNIETIEIVMEVVRVETTDLFLDLWEQINTQCPQLSSAFAIFYKASDQHIVADRTTD